MIIKTQEYTPDTTTAISIFDNSLKLDRANLICISARVGMGKTSLALHIALEYALKSKKAVYFISSDHYSSEIYTRLLCGLSKTNISKAVSRNHSTEEKARLVTAYNTLKKLNIVINDEATPVDFLDDQDDIGLVIIDSENVSSLFIHSLKDVAKRKNIPVIFTHKLDKSLEKRKDKRPTLNDMQDIYQDVDTVVFIYREGYYATSEDEAHTDAEIIIAKNRYSPLNTFRMKWQGEYMTFC